MMMKPVILRHSKSLKDLPLALNNNIEVVKKILNAGHSNFKVLQVQDVEGILFFTERTINDRNIYELFGAQIELLLKILKYLNENIDVHERYEIFTGFKSEYEILAQLETKPVFEILADHIGFMGNELIPIVNVHIQRIDDELRIKNHKSFVRKKLTDKGIVTFQYGIDDSVIQNILAYFKLKCSTIDEFIALENELINSAVSHFEFYNLDNVTCDEVILFFKLMQERQILSQIPTLNLAKWVHRKFRYSKNGTYSILLKQRPVIDKFYKKLTAKEKTKELNIDFKRY